MYADNLFVICKPYFVAIKGLTRDLGSALALPYGAFVEEVSHIGITILDLWLWEDSWMPHINKLDVAHALKPISCGYACLIIRTVYCFDSSSYLKVIYLFECAAV